MPLFLFLWISGFTVDRDLPTSAFQQGEIVLRVLSSLLSNFSWDEVSYLTHRLCMFGYSTLRLFLAFGSGRFFAHGLRLSLMSKKVSTFALRHKMAASLRIPKQDRHSLNGELEPHRPHGNCERLGSSTPRRVSISLLASRPWVTAVPLSSGVNPDEILPRETRKSSHCGRVAFSFQSW